MEVILADDLATIRNCVTRELPRLRGDYVYGSSFDEDYMLIAAKEAMLLHNELVKELKNSPNWDAVKTALLESGVNQYFIDCVQMIGP